MIRVVGCSTMMLPSRSRQMNLGTRIPMVSSKPMPARRSTAPSCGCVPRPTPRLASSSALRSNTTASQPVLRRRGAARSPPSEPPITSARRAVIRYSRAGGLRPSQHRPAQIVVAGLVVGIGLRRIAVDERAAIHRVGLAARLVLDGEQHFTAVEVDHVSEAVLVFVGFHRDQAELLEPAMRTGEVRQINLYMVVIARRLRRVGLAEIEILLFADLDAGLGVRAVLDDVGRRLQHFAIEARAAVGGAGADVETDKG